MELLQVLCISTAIYLQFILFLVSLDPSEVLISHVLLYLVCVSSSLFMWYNPITMILCTTIFVSLRLFMYYDGENLKKEKSIRQGEEWTKNIEKIKKQINDLRQNKNTKHQEKEGDGFETEFAEKESKSKNTNYKKD